MATAWVSVPPLNNQEPLGILLSFLIVSVFICDINYTKIQIQLLSRLNYIAHIKHSQWCFEM